MADRSAVIITVGSELVEGLRLDTNTAEVARALAPRGFRVVEALSIGDDLELLAETLGRLVARFDLVLCTGGLGPTHDDITAEAAARAVGKRLERNERLVMLLEPVVARHRDDEAAEQVLRQAMIIEGAEVIEPTTGTASGQVVKTPAGLLVLLPGPPTEMRGMLDRFAERYELVHAKPRELGVVGLGESDAQVLAQRALGDAAVGLAVLSRPGDVRVILLDEGAGLDGVERAVADVADALGEYCYATDGATLQATVMREAIDRGVKIAAAESCTGGMVCAALTEFAGSSASFVGGVVSYHNDAKADIIEVPRHTLDTYGAVSEQTAAAMAEGVARRLGADIAVSVTGIAGPGGGTPEKPVGLVWFGLTTPEGTSTEKREFSPTSRESIRLRATATALDLLRRAVLRR